MAASNTGLKNGTLVWTPEGFTPIERLQIGARVVGGDGTKCTVLGIARKRPIRMLRLTFDRGVQVECGTKQTWRVLHPAARFPTRHSHGRVELNPRYDKWEVVTAEAMLAMSGAAPLPRRRFLMPAPGSIRMTAKRVPIDPYLLGVLLGDGCLRNGVKISTADQEIVDAVAALLPPDLIMRKERKYDYNLVLPGGKGHGRGGSVANGHPLTRILREFGLHGLLSGAKFVPDAYLYNSAKMRLALLQGLMDTDGSVTATQGSIEFSSTSPHLAAAVEFLVASFGGKTATEGRTTQYTDKYGARKDGAPSFRVRIRLPQVVPFRLSRKIARLVNPVSTRGAWLREERVIGLKVVPTLWALSAYVGSEMKNSSWAKIKNWISLNLFKQPVREMPRERCVHNVGCYLCPRSRCVGALNDRHDPDLTRPRPSSSGHCIHIHGENGLVILRVSMETANAHSARRAAEEQERIPHHLRKPPGYDEEDVAALLKSIAD